MLELDVGKLYVVYDTILGNRLTEEDMFLLCIERLGLLYSAQNTLWKDLTIKGNSFNRGNELLFGEPFMVLDKTIKERGIVYRLLQCCELGVREGYIEFYDKEENLYPDERMLFSKYVVYAAGSV